MYLSGEGVEKDETKAVEYFLKGAEKGLSSLDMFFNLHQKPI